MIEMFQALFPTDKSTFKLTHNEFRRLGRTLGAHIRARSLFNAFGSPRNLRRAFQLGELWTFQTDQIHVAACSFAGLLRAVGGDTPEMFDDIYPPLPRHDFGLVLSYDTAFNLPWRLSWSSESRSDMQDICALTLPVLLSDGFAFDCRRASSSAVKVMTQDRHPRPFSH